MTTMTGSIGSTERIYYQNTYQSTHDATLLKVDTDDKGTYVVLDQTIFHPQGGGQPDDKGFLEINKERFDVIKLDAPRNPKEDPYIIKHYIDAKEEVSSTLEVGSKVTETVDLDARKEYARWHSAGHLLANVVEELYPELEGVQGNHFPGKSAFVTFTGGRPDKTELKQKVAGKVNDYTKAGLPLTNNWKGETRTVQFKGLKAYPCGGTHVQNSSEIGTISIRNVKNAKVGREKTLGLRIGYTITT